MADPPSPNAGHFRFDGFASPQKHFHGAITRFLIDWPTRQTHSYPMLKIELPFLNPSMASLTVAMFSMLCFSSCQEHKRLDSEITKTRTKTDSLRMQLNIANDEYHQCAKSLSELESRKNTNAGIPSSIEQEGELQIELNALNDLKTRLEQDLQRLQDELEAYKKLTA